MRHKYFVIGTKQVWNMKNIDLGCGEHCENGFEGLDFVKYKNVKYVVDLNKGKLPFKNNEVDNFYCANVLEHLNNPETIIQECHRCLKVWGFLEICVPYWSHPNAVGPGHKNYWNFSSLTTFDDSFVNVSNMHWELVSLSWDCKVSNPLMKLIYVPINLLIKHKRTWYESYLSRIFPIGELRIIVQKVKK